MTQDINVILYRYDSMPDATEGHVYIREFKPVKATLKGWWIEDWGPKSGKRFIRADTRKAFAYANLTDALNSFVIRKEHYVSRLENRLESAKRALEMGKELQAGKTLDEVNYPKRDNFTFPGFTA